MKKILTFVSFSLVGMTASLATGSSLFKSGVYTGLILGYSYMNAGVQESLSLPAPYSVDASDKKRGTRHGVLGELMVGYRHVFQNGFLGGIEVGIAKENQALRRSFDLDGYLTTVKLHRSFQITPALVIGNVLSEKWLGFVKLGMSLSRLKMRHSIGTLGLDPEIETVSKTKIGLSATVGAEYALTSHVSAVGMLTYERFSKVRKGLNAITSIVPGGANALSFKPYYVTAKVGVVYRF